MQPTCIYHNICYSIRMCWKQCKLSCHTIIGSFFIHTKYTFMYSHKWEIICSFRIVKNTPNFSADWSTFAEAVHTDTQTLEPQVPILTRHTFANIHVSTFVSTPYQGIHILSLQSFKGKNFWRG